MVGHGHSFHSPIPPFVGYWKQWRIKLPRAEDSKGRDGRWEGVGRGSAFVPVLCGLQERALDRELGNLGARTCTALAGVREEGRMGAGALQGCYFC